MRDVKYRRWKRALKKCLSWDTTCNSNDDIIDYSYEDKGKFIVFFFRYLYNFFFFSDPELAVRCSIPGSIFIFSSIALLLITQFIQKNNGILK